jgi:hypothetical protein
MFHPAVVRPEVELEEKNARPVLIHSCFRQFVPRFDPDRLVLLAMPREIRNRTPTAGEWFLLNGRCPLPREAAEVAAHFLSPEIQGLIARTRFGIPVLKTAAMDSMDSRRYRDDLFFNEIRNIAPYAAADHDFMQRLNTLVDEVSAGAMEFDELLRAVEYEISTARKQAAVRRRLASEDDGLGRALPLYDARAPAREGTTGQATAVQPIRPTP